MNKAFAAAAIAMHDKTDQRKYATAKANAIGRAGLRDRWAMPTGAKVD
jgi:hypothetical protein